MFDKLEFATITIKVKKYYYDGKPICHYCPFHYRNISASRAECALLDEYLGESFNCDGASTPLLRCPIHYPVNTPQFLLKGYKYTLADDHDYYRTLHFIFKFDNGYGASVARTHGTYGSDECLWELVVLDSEGYTTFDTPITSSDENTEITDPEGYLTESEVSDLLDEISNLAPK